MRVQVTRPAVDQLGAILDDLRLKNPRAADRLAKRWRTVQDEIAANPHLGRRQDVEGVRKRIIQPGSYLVYYSVDGRENLVSILAIVHPARRRPYDDA